MRGLSTGGQSEAAQVRKLRAAGAKKVFREMASGAMQTYFGGRSEVHLRRVISKVLYSDFLSMYPTVCTLMGLWRWVIAKGISWPDTTDETRALLALGEDHETGSSASGGLARSDDIGSGFARPRHLAGGKPICWRSAIHHRPQRNQR
jgi:hypothetical protein